MNLVLSRNCEPRDDFLGEPDTNFVNAGNIAAKLFRGRQMIKLLALSMIFYSSIKAQTFQNEDILVSSKVKNSKNEFTQKVEVIDDLKQSSTELLLQRLAEVPGVFINQAGGPGSQSSIHIRGSESRHVLVLIDGIRINDPSKSSKEADISSLSIADIEKIEIIKGAQSLMYGSDAIGGVINIITKKKLDKNKLTLVYGFTKLASLSQGVANEKTSATLFAQNSESDGISSFRKGKEKDGFVTNDLTFNLTHEYNSKFKSEFIYKVNDQYIEFDNSPIDEKGVYANNLQQVLGHKLLFNLGTIDISLLSSLNRSDRSNNFGASSSILYEGREVVNDLNIVYKKDNTNFLLGLENLKEEFKQSNIGHHDAYINSLYIINSWQKEKAFGQVGARLSQHQVYGTYLSPGFGLGQSLNSQQKVSFNYQKGFNSPSLYQLFGEDTNIGKLQNLELAPERSDSIDLNFHLDSQKSLSLHYTKIDNIIINSLTPENASYLEISGVELNLGENFKNFYYNLAFEVLHYQAAESGVVYKRPKQRVSFESKIFLSEQDEINLNIIYVGERVDQDFNSSPPQDVSLHGFDLVNISYTTYQKNYELSFGIDNLLDRSYELSYQYSTLPRTYFTRLRFYY